MRTILAAALALLLMALPRAGEAATLNISAGPYFITYKIHDDDGAFLFGDDIWERGTAYMTVTDGANTYSDKGRGEFFHWQFCYGCYGVPYPFDFFISFVGERLEFAAEGSYNGDFGMPAYGGYLYQGSAGFSIVQMYWDFEDIGSYIGTADVMISAVPIPASGLLLLGSLTALGLLNRRRLTSR